LAFPTLVMVIFWLQNKLIVQHRFDGCLKMVKFIQFPCGDPISANHEVSSDLFWFSSILVAKCYFVALPTLLVILWLQNKL